MLTAEVEALFNPDFNSDLGITLVITVGNYLRSDDSVGPYIAGNIHSPRKNLIVLDAGDRPENFIDRAVEANPTKTIIIDAADFGGVPGELRIIPEHVIPDKPLSTHSFPLSIIARLLAEDTGSEVSFLGIQPENMDFGEGLSPKVKSAADEIIKLINAALMSDAV